MDGFQTAFTEKDSILNKPKSEVISNGVYRSIIETSTAGFCVIDSFGQFIDVNRAFCSITGYGTEELMTMKIQDIEICDSAVNYESRFGSITESVHSVFIQCKNGKIIHVEKDVNWLDEDDGRQFIFIRNITEKKEYDKRFLDSEEHYRSLFEDSPVALWQYDGTIIRDSVKTLLEAGINDLKPYFDKNPESLFSCISKLNIIDVNKAALTLFEAESKEELMSDIGKLFTAPESINTFIQALNAYISGREDFTTETTIQSLKGRRSNILFRISFPRGKREKWTKTLITMVDITEKRQTELALRKIEWLLQKKSSSGKPGKLFSPSYGDLVKLNTFRLIYDSLEKDVIANIVGDFVELLDTMAVVFEKNGDYSYRNISSSWCRLLDSASRTLCNTESNEEAIKCGKWLCHESCWTKAGNVAIKNGETIEVRCSGGINVIAVPVFVNGQTIGSVVAGYGDPPMEPDRIKEIAGKYKVNLEELQRCAAEYQSRPSFMISFAKSRLLTSAELIGEIVKRKQIREVLNQTVSALYRSNEELEQFAYVASHDLQEPLRAINNFAQLLEKRYKSKLDKDADEIITYITKEASCLQQQIDELMELSRVNTQGKPFKHVNAMNIFMKSIASLRNLISESEAAITHDPMPDIVCDEAQVVQVFQNLIANAIKFRSEKPPEIHIGVCRKEYEWLFSVRDNGIGIESKYFERIFIIFKRLHKRDKYPGTGMGLAICKKIVERHDGSIWVESEPDVGSVFYFTIPVRGDNNLE